ncbi:NHL repeat-containing protein [Gilvimarinus polysaccharolyticus]|uniref:hypothetical protein n=1 Tax=Gilvimarinus polysaccharolyticus TaxID=863921 RepID=UPI0006736951|nr:hypothetical protein [Gilvimarinus polysaccharolyticus]
MKGKSRVAAMVIVVFFVLSIGLYFWAGAQRSLLPSYGFMHPSGEQLVVNFGSQFIWLDAAGREQSTLDLTELSMTPVGDFGFFADGDLLVYHRVERLSLLENLAAFLRLRSNRVVGVSLDDGFYRCSLELEQCRPLAHSQRHPARSFRLLLEPQSDVIYLADTAAHTLYKLTAEGQVLAKNDGDFKFPNQLLIRAGDLWLADTNHHRVVRVATATENFAQELQAFAVQLGGQYRWPHQLAGGDEGLWVLVGNNAMADGRLQLYSWAGESLRPLTPAEHGDPLAIYRWQDRLWLNDFSHPSLVMIDPSTGVTAPVDSPTLAGLTDQTLKAEDGFRRLEWLALGVLALVLIGGFSAAWVLEKDQTRAHLSGLKRASGSVVAAGVIEPTGQQEVLWIASRIKWYHWWLARSYWVVTLSFVIFMAWDYQSLVKMPAMLWLVCGSAVFMALVGIMANQLLTNASRTKLGVIGESLVLVSADGVQSIARGKEVAYSSQFIFVDDVTVALGGPQLRFYDEQELKRWVYPRLAEAQKLNNQEQTKRLWQRRHPQLIWPLVLVLMIGVAALAVQLYS